MEKNLAQLTPQQLNELKENLTISMKNGMEKVSFLKPSAKALMLYIFEKGFDEQVIRSQRISDIKQLF